MIKAGVLCAILGLSAAIGLVSAFDFSYEVSTSDMQTAEKAAKYFEKLHELLSIKVPDNYDGEENMKATKEIVAGMSDGTFHKSSKKAAFELVVALEAASEQCLNGSFKTFVTNLFASGKAQRELNVRIRTDAILEHYWKKHAEKCREFYRTEYSNLVQKLDASVMPRIEASLRDLTPDDLSRLPPGPFLHPIASGRRSFLEKQWSSLSEAPLLDATKKILKNIIEQVKQSPSDWDSVKPYVDAKAVKSVVPKPSKELFDEYLFKPCAEHERVLGELLSSAKFDSFIEKEKGGDFLAGEQEFYQALVRSRICKRVLGEQSKLVPVLAREWENKVIGSL